MVPSLIKRVRNVICKYSTTSLPASWNSPWLVCNTANRMDLHLPTLEESVFSLPLTIFSSATNDSFPHIRDLVTVPAVTPWKTPQFSWMTLLMLSWGRQTTCTFNGELYPCKSFFLHKVAHSHHMVRNASQYEKSTFRLTLALGSRERDYIGHRLLPAAIKRKRARSHPHCNKAARLPVTRNQTSRIALDFIFR